MSQELPSFHDWGQAGSSPLPAGKAAEPFPGPAALPDAAAATASKDADASSSHQAPQPSGLLSHPGLILSSQRMTSTGDSGEEAARQQPEQNAEQQEEDDSALIQSAEAVKPDGVSDAEHDPSAENLQQGVSMTKLWLHCVFSIAVSSSALCQCKHTSWSLMQHSLASIVASRHAGVTGYFIVL